MAHAHYSSDDDDESILAQIAQAESASVRLFGRVRRTAPPRARAHQKSVFGTSASSRSAADSRDDDRKLAAIALERRAQAELQRDIDALKVSTPAATHAPELATTIADEDHLAALAADANNISAVEKHAFEKYQMPCVFFTQPEKWPQTPSIPSARSTVRRNPLHALVLRAEQTGNNLGRFFSQTVSVSCNHGAFPPLITVAVLLHRVIFDPTPCEPGVEGRQHEMDAITTILEHTASTRRNMDMMPRLIEVLTSFGVHQDDCEFPTSRRIVPSSTARIQSLDEMVQGNMRLCFPQLNRAIRNLTRAFVIWSHLLTSEIDLDDMLGKCTSSVEDADELEYTLWISRICVRLLMSPFGIHLHDAVGRFLESLFDRIPHRTWCQFCHSFANDTVTCIDRLGILADFVVHQLPQRTSRARIIALEIAYKISWRWCAGPAENPTPRGLPNELPDTTAKVSQEGLNFGIEDVIAIIREIPDVNKNTDCHWLEPLGRLLKFLILEGTILRRADRETTKRILDSIEWIRKQVHRLPLSVPGRSFLLNLDQTMSGVRAFHLRLLPQDSLSQPATTLQSGNQKRTPFKPIDLPFSKPASPIRKTCRNNRREFKSPKTVQPKPPKPTPPCVPQPVSSENAPPNETPRPKISASLALASVPAPTPVPPSVPREQILLNAPTNRRRERRVLRCHFCDAMFTQKSRLERHLAEEHEDNRCRIQCDQCSKTLNSPNSLERHMRFAHHKLFQCPHCNVRFGLKETLATHIKTNHMRQPQPRPHSFVFPPIPRKREPSPATATATEFKCSKCGLAFASKHLRATHIRNSHVR